MLQFFAFAHLPEALQLISSPFADLAVKLCESLPECEERAFALRKLLEAKDCAVRAAIGQPVASAAMGVLNPNAPGPGSPGFSVTQHGAPLSPGFGVSQTSIDKPPQ